MHEPLKNRTFQGKKLLFNFLGAHFLAPKSGHRREKQPVLGPGYAPITNFWKTFVKKLTFSKIMPLLDTVLLN